MHYVYGMELGALLFLMLLGMQYLSVRQFPNATNRVFGYIILCAVADIALDLATSLIIENAAVVPLIAVYAANTVFYAMQVLFPALMLLYVLLLTGDLKRFFTHCIPLLLPALFSLALLIANFYKPIIFYVASGVYTRGPWFNVLYAGTVFYIIATLLLAFFRRDRLTHTQFQVVLSFVCIITAAVVIQFLYPALLLTGVAMTMAIMMMYFVLENPESMRDFHTGTFNYGALQYMLRARISTHKPFYITVMDVRNIQAVNDLLGLDTGNRLMADIGAGLMKLGKRVWAFHMRDARFVMLCFRERDHQRVIEALAARLEAPVRIFDVPVITDIIVRYFSDTEGAMDERQVFTLLNAPVEAFGAADVERIAALDVNAGGLHRSLAIESDLRAALEGDRGAFSLRFQPLYSLQNDRYDAAEVLLRFTGQNTGPVSPAEFIPIAEQSGLIRAIDDMVTRLACAAIVRCPYIEQLKHIQINLSAAEFWVSDLPARMAAIAKEYGVDPGMIAFEITETAAAESFAATESILHEMIDAGFRFVLDDFGSGYSNVARAIQLPFFQIKLDKSLLRSDEASFVLLDSLVDMFKRMGVGIVMEGVETTQQDSQVRRLGVDYIQGFYYAKPMTEGDYEEFLRREDARSGS